jgi:predicted transcriptional regulator
MLHSIRCQEEFLWKKERIFRWRAERKELLRLRGCQQIAFDLSRRTPYDKWEDTKANMDMIPLKPERKAQLEEYAKRRGQDPAAALDDALATYLEWERQDFAEAVEGIRHGYEDVRAGRTRPAAEFLADLRRKHDLPR